MDPLGQNISKFSWIFGPGLVKLSKIWAKLKCQIICDKFQASNNLYQNESDPNFRYPIQSPDQKVLQFFDHYQLMLGLLGKCQQICKNLPHVSSWARHFSRLSAKFTTRLKKFTMRMSKVSYRIISVVIFFNQPCCLLQQFHVIVGVLLS